MRTVIRNIFIFCAFVVVTGCRKATSEVAETIGTKAIASEVVEESAKLSIKSFFKSLIGNGSKEDILNLGLKSEVAEKISKELSEGQLAIFLKEAKKFDLKTIKEFNKNPSLVSAYKKLIDVPHRNNLNCLYQVKKWIEDGAKGDVIIKIPRNINEKLVGKVMNGIPFVRKQISFRGIIFEGVFPDFSKYKVFSREIGEDFLDATDKKQFEICRAQLRKAFDENENNVKKMFMAQNRRFAENGGIVSKKRLITDPEEMWKIQKKDIRQENGGTQQERIFGFIWHHNENVGQIDLVAYDMHDNVKHIGGRSIWGGGSSKRK